jgi:hypothetical protein
VRYDLYIYIYVVRRQRVNFSRIRGNKMDMKISEIVPKREAATSASLL